MIYGTTHKLVATGVLTITPDDGADLSYVTRGIFCGTAGDLKVTMADGSIATLGNLAAGVIHPIAVRKVWSTGTAALGIKGFV